MTTPQRNAATLALLAPLACPLVDVLCALYVALTRLYARTITRVIEALKADRAARLALAARRAAMLSPVHCPMNVPVPAASYTVGPVPGDGGLIIDAPLLRRLAELTAPLPCDEVVTVAACKPVKPAPAPPTREQRVAEFDAQVVRHALAKRLRSEPIGRRELQAIAKAHGVRANSSNPAIRAAVLALLEARGI